jgi:hypothetical protein
MNQTIEAILIYCLWSLSLTLLLVTIRVFFTCTGKKAANSFMSCGTDVSAFCTRLIRAHANCYENLPVVLGILASSLFLGQAELTNTLAIPFALARILQSITHLISINVIAVNIRFIFFFIQIIISIYWCVGLLIQF